MTFRISGTSVPLCVVASSGAIASYRAYRKVYVFHVR